MRSRLCAENAKGGACDVNNPNLMRCRVRDGGRSSEAAQQGEASNHRKLRRSRAEVVSVTEKALTKASGEVKKVNASKPPMKCRKRTDDVKTGRESLTRDKPGRNPESLTRWRPAQRWHELDHGSYRELGNLSFGAHLFEEVSMRARKGVRRQQDASEESSSSGSARTNNRNQAQGRGAP
jgi:hypothetical protein